MHDTLPVIFACVLVLGIAIYVCLDGMDLGIGILYLVAPLEADRDLMIATVEPVWDGNETWLVLGAMILFAGFPTALAVLLPALYLPIIVMLFSLVLRGISFEFRGRAVRSKRAWDYIFSLASVVATLCQGLVLGTFVGGGIIPGHAEAFGFLSWFSAATSLGLVAGYALLGATWLIWRTGGSAQTFAREIARPCMLAVAAFIVLMGVWTPLAQADVAARWFALPSVAGLVVTLSITVLTWFFLWRSIWGPRELLPYLLTIAIFGLGLIGLCATVYPYAIPHHLTLWEAASRPETLEVTGIGLAICLPLVIAYLSFSYWIFKGKVTTTGDYS